MRTHPLGKAAIEVTVSRVVRRATPWPGTPTAGTPILTGSACADDGMLIEHTNSIMQTELKNESLSDSWAALRFANRLGVLTILHLHLQHR